MSESREAKKIKTIAFRLTDEEYALAESAAIAAGDETPNNWCRALALAKANAGEGMTKNQRLLYEEIARVRYLVGHGFRVLFGPEPITGGNMEEDNGGRGPEFRDHRRRPTLPKEVAPTANTIPRASQQAADCQLTLLRNTYRVGFHNRPVLE